VNLDGAVAIVTGGGGAMGSSMVQALAAAGTTVICADIDLERAENATSEASATAQAAVVDVTDSRAVQQLVEQTIAQFGRIDVLINNAGIFRAIGAVWEVEADLWWRDVATNLLGPFLCCRAVLPHMIARNAGVIVNISGGGFGSAVPGGSGYTSSKAGLIRMTQTLALEVGSRPSTHGIRGEGRDVRVYGVEPAFVAGAMNTTVAESPGGRRWLPFVGALLDAGEVRMPGPVGAAIRRLVELAPPELSGLTFSYEEDVADLAARADELRRLGRCQIGYRGPDDG
jgi:3-oxoacyl-[acyl-carrier protein] reductase